MFSVLKHRSFRNYVFGNVFALNGNWMQRVTLGWIAWDLTGSSAFVGLIAFLIFGPTIVSGPIFGVLVDRANLIKAAQITQSSLAVIMMGLFGAEMLGVLSAGVLVIAACIVGFVTSAHHPVRMSLGPLLVPRDAIGQAIAFTSANFNLARMTGPAIGGVLISSAGVETTLLVNALLFMPMVAIIPSLRPRDRDNPDTQRGQIVAAMVEGARHVLTQPLLRDAMILTGIFSLIARGAIEISPAIADGLFQRGAVGLGQMTAAAGAGALISSLLQTRIVGAPGDRLPTRALIGIPVGFVLLVMLTVITNWFLVLLVMAGLGMAGTTVGVSLQTTIQTRVDDRYRGRVMSLWTVVGVGAAAVGAILLGGLAEFVGLSTALSGAGVIALVFSITLAVLRRRDWL